MCEAELRGQGVGTAGSELLPSWEKGAHRAVAGWSPEVGVPQVLVPGRGWPWWAERRMLVLPAREEVTARVTQAVRGRAPDAPRPKCRTRVALMRETDTVHPHLTGVFRGVQGDGVGWGTEPPPLQPQGTEFRAEPFVRPHRQILSWGVSALSV